MYYYLVIQDSIPYLYWSESEEPAPSHESTLFFAEISRTDALILSRIIRQYRDKLYDLRIKGLREYLEPCIIPFKYVDISGAVPEFSAFQKAVERGEVKLVDGVIYK